MNGLQPLALLNDFILPFNVGQVVLLLFLLTLPVGVVKKSRRITSINVVMFGLLFAIVPSIGGGPSYYAFLGLALLVIGPVLYATADR